MNKEQIINNIISDLEKTVFKLYESNNQSEQNYQIRDIDGIHSAIDLRNCQEIHNYIYNEYSITKKELYKFKQWLNKHYNDYVVLYHGTSSKNQIMKRGLFVTTLKRRHSFQSESGYVYLSMYPDAARLFGEMSYPYNDVTVYAVIVKIKELKPDIDQLNNKRSYFDFEIGNSLAESLIFGHGARIKRSIKPYEIRLTNF